MVRKLKIRKIGGSLGAIFPKELLEELNASEGTEVVVTRSGRGVLLTPDAAETTTMLEAFEHGRRKYRETLRRLAE